MNRTVEQVVRLKNMVPLWHLSDPRTSERAAKLVARYSDSQAASVLFALLAAEPFGLTYYDLERRLTMRSAKQRLADLKRHDLVYGTGEYRMAYGSSAEVYRPVQSVVHTINGTEQGALL